MKNIKGIVEISGFGKESGYELACQQMLQKGWEWLQSHPNAKLKAHTYSNIFGILECDNKETEELSDTITKDIEGGCTGAMHQAVMQHLLYIHNNGLNKWKSEIKKKSS